MTRLLNVILVTFCLLFIGQQVSAANVVGTAMYESATLWGAPNGGRAYPVCSGVVLRSNAEQTYVATARHCVTEGKVATVRFYDGDIGVVQAWKVSPTADAAILLVASRHHAAASTNDALPEGADLFVIGAASGESWSYSSAHSRSGDRYDPGSNIPVYEIECPSCFFGDSGAPIFNSGGQVVGLLVGGGDANYPAVVDITPVHYATVLLP